MKKRDQLPRLLFVDDDPNAFQVWGDPLSTDYKWDVAQALGPVEAKTQLQNAESTGHPFDVVIIDRQMPDPKTKELKADVGDELLKDITARWRYVCPIMLTSFGGEIPAQQATRYGAYRYLLKGTDVRTLNCVCRKGMQMQLVKRRRHTLLYMGSPNQVVDELKSNVSSILSPHAYGLACLKQVPGGQILIGSCVYHGCAPGRLATALEGGGAFVSGFRSIEEVRESRRYRLRTKRVEIKPEHGSLLDSPGSQLIVPILESENPPQRLATNVVAFLWMESVQEEAFSQEDAEIFSALADYVGIALPGAKVVEERRLTDRAVEREGLLSELAHRICNPLQIAQSNVDFIAASLRRADKLESTELTSQLEQALKSIEQAIQAAEELRQGSSPRRITLKPLKLATLAQEVADSFQARARAVSCQIDTRINAVVPMVKLDQAEMRYVLNCILENALEAIQQRRAKSRGEPQTGQIRLSLCADPEGTKSVLLSVQDNGCGIDPKVLPRIFDRYFTTKEQDFRKAKQGLGLSDAKRFVEKAHGTIEIANIPKGGAIVRILLLACKRGDPPEVILV